MKALVLVVLVLSGGVARAADDAPVMLDAGVPAPFAGTLVPSAVRITEGKRVAQLEAENASLTAHLDSDIPVWLVVTLTVVGAVVGGATVFGVCRATGGCNGTP